MLLFIVYTTSELLAISSRSEIFPCLFPVRPPYYVMVRVALWDRCTAAGGLRVLHPSHDAPRSLFARVKPAPGDESAIFPLDPVTP